MIPSQPGVRSRTTWQRGAILRAIEASQCHVPAEEIHQRLRRGGRSLGLATVYRALEAFVREGVVDSVHVGDGLVRYGLAANHHDHLVCLGCGEWKPIQECRVRRTPARTASGFHVTGHQLRLYGYCARCQVSRAQLG
jgi:Fur family ferric uptake transcriptional regulator